MLTDEQTEHELRRIRRGALSWEEYKRVSRVGESFRMSRADRRAVYSVHLEQRDAVDNKKKAQLKNRLSYAGNRAYDAICRERDGGCI